MNQEKIRELIKKIKNLPVIVELVNYINKHDIL